jgi:Ca2+-binding RTX toxin-like protein
MLLGGAGDDLFLDFGAKHNVIDGGTGLNFAQNNPKDTMTNIFQVIDPPPGVTPSVATLAAAIPLDSGGAVTDSVSNGVLKIAGTSGDDTISVKSNGVKVKVKADGVALTPILLADLVGVSVKGKGGDDVITIEPSVLLPSTLSGGGGNDSLAGGGGDNVIIAGNGNDTLVGGAGMNLLVPGNFQTYSATSPGNDDLEGGSGYSIADFSYRTDALVLSNNGQADSGDPLLDEKMTIGTDIAAIWGGTGNDTITGTHGGEFLSGGNGADSISGGGANDLLVGGKNSDTVAVAAEPVTLYLRDNQVDDYSGVSNPNEDILVLDLGLDILLA